MTRRQPQCQRWGPFLARLPILSIYPRAVCLSTRQLPRQPPNTLLTACTVKNNCVHTQTYCIYTHIEYTHIVHVMCVYRAHEQQAMPLSANDIWRVRLKEIPRRLLSYWTRKTLAKMHIGQDLMQAVGDSGFVNAASSSGNEHMKTQIYGIKNNGF